MSRQRRTIWNSVGYWLAEIVVVFIGVYLAFLLNGYRTHRQNEHKKQQIYAALYRYFSNVAPELKEKSAKKDSSFFSPFIKSYNNGKMPRLKKSAFIRTSYNDRTWNAILQAGGINLLNVKFIQQVSSYFGTNQIFTEVTDHFNHMQDKYLLPHYNENSNVFYNLKSKKLKPTYEWYINSMRQFRAIFHILSIKANRILKTLKQKMNKKQLQKLSADSTP